jgi:hypothetical protein
MVSRPTLDHSDWRDRHCSERRQSYCVCSRYVGGAPPGEDLRRSRGYSARGYLPHHLVLAPSVAVWAQPDLAALSPHGATGQEHFQAYAYLEGADRLSLEHRSKRNSGARFQGRR